MAERQRASEPDPRASREEATRASEMRAQNWAPPSVLPDPRPEPGYVYRWVRTATLGQQDVTNVSRQMREGYVPVRAEDHPELQLMTDPNSRFKGNIEVGGLLLCKIPEETARQRAAHYEGVATQQMEAVENSFMRENDPRMPVLKSERQTTVSFGKTALRE